MSVHRSHITNEIMLITYANSMGRNLAELNTVLTQYFKSAVRGVHILPFFPSSADRGFAPLTYKEINDQFGTWQHIQAIASNFYLMFDFMINHISRSSKYFMDYQKNKNNSRYKDLFIRYNEFWKHGEPSQEQVDLIYKRKERAPYVHVKFSDGSTEKIWCTFSEEQIDIDVRTQTAKDFFLENLTFLCEHHASIIRLDAFAYIIKKINTNCFFVEPDIWKELSFIDNIVRKHNVLLLPEIHEHYTVQQKIAERGYYVYDFALPMLVLHALYSQKNHNLIHWLELCPRRQFTTLDTHDGIGVVDVSGLMTEEEINFTKEKLFDEGANVKRIYNTEKYKNLDTYQINCTYYSALGNNDDAYLLSRAIQFYCPGIPQVYYVGLLAGKNDIDLLEQTKEGRNINRHNYSLEEIKRELERDVVKKLITLMEFRNQYKAFDGDLTIENGSSEDSLRLIWRKGDLRTILNVDLSGRTFVITYIDVDSKQEKRLVL